MWPLLLLAISSFSALAADKKEVPAEGPLDLDTCFKLAAIRSDTLAMSEQDIRAANARYGQAISALFPTIGFRSSQNFQNKNATSFVGSGRIVAGREYSSENSLTASYPIFDGFRNYNTVGARNAEAEARTFDLKRNYQTLYQDVATAFYQIVMNDRDLEILKELDTNLGDRVTELKDRVRLGRSRPAEQLASQTDSANARVTVEQVTGLRNAARESLAFFIGKPAESLQLIDRAPLPSSASLEAYLSSVQARPDILAAIASQRQARRELSIAKGEFLPQVNASGSYYLSQDPPSKQEYNFTFTIELPLFDGGLIYNKVREQRELFRKSELNVDQIRRTADQDVRTTFSDFNASVAQVVRLREAIRISEENYIAQKQDYQKGVVSNLDVLNALRQFNEARRSLLEQEINTKINLIKLHVAAGQVKPS